MRFPLDTKVGDYFWVNDEPVRVTAWYYLYGLGTDRFFDIEFLDVLKDNRPAATMALIPIGYDFYGATIRRMSTLEMELF